MAKFLVTGGAGFIGSNFLNIMVKKYPSNFYVCLDALTYAGNLENIKDVSLLPNFKFVHGNICDKNLVFTLFEKEKFDYVINFAAETHVDRSIKNPEKFIETNIIGTVVLLEASVKYGVKRFHQISTDEVYGDLPLEYKGKGFNENSNLNPSNPYSASKASADLITLAYARTYGLNVTISRCSNNYGPCQFSEKLIPLIIKNIKEGKNIPIYGDGNNVRDWIYVDDHCEAIDLIINKGRSGQIYNISAHYELANINLAKLVINKFGLDDERITFVNDRLGHDLRYSLDTEKIENELDWHPSVSFEEGIEKTYFVHHTITSLQNWSCRLRYCICITM